MYIKGLTCLNALSQPGTVVAEQTGGYHDPAAPPPETTAAPSCHVLFLSEFRDLQVMSGRGKKKL